WFKTLFTASARNFSSFRKIAITLTRGGRAFRSMFSRSGLIQDKQLSGRALTNDCLRCRIGEHDPDEWDLPPEPKWMRWRTYNRLLQKFDGYEDTVEQKFATLMARFRGR